MAVPPFMAGMPPAGFGHPKGCHRLFPISTPFDYISVSVESPAQMVIDSSCRHASELMDDLFLIG
jgi:hypothetical protein